jgi:hypothetical protein
LGHVFRGIVYHGYLDADGDLFMVRGESGVLWREDELFEAVPLFILMSVIDEHFRAYTSCGEVYITTDNPYNPS